MQQKEVAFTERDVAEIIYQILLGINYIHNSQMMHRDMKLENVMIDIVELNEDESQMICKITDFGFACMMDPARRSSLSIGTPIYMAPEVLNRAYDVKADIWSVGVIAYIMLTGKQPFEGKDGDQNDLFTSIRYKSPDYEVLEKYNDDGMQVINFIQKCLNKNPKTRWDAEELLAHKWFRTHVIDQQVPDDQLVEARLNLLTFKQSSLFQSSIIAFLVGLKTGKEEQERMSKIFK